MWPWTPRRTRIRPVATQQERDTAVGLLSEELPEPLTVPFPPWPIPHKNGLHPEIFGVWQNRRLIGAGFIGPDIEDARNVLRSNPAAYQESKQILTDVAMIHGIAIHPESRRQGLGLDLKLTLTHWAETHGAQAVISVPVTDPSRRLNTRAGYFVFKPNITLIMQFENCNTRIALPIIGNATWSIYQLRQASKPSLTISQAPPIP
jgi:hypothetical protein